MNPHAAMVMDFGLERMARRRRAASSKPHVSLEDAQRRLTRCCAWLEQAGVCVEGFGFSTLSRPVVFAPAVPTMWILFSGRVESKGHRRDGAMRYEVFEGLDEHNMVDVRWERVAACA